MLKELVQYVISGGVTDISAADRCLAPLPFLAWLFLQLAVVNSWFMMAFFTIYRE